MTQQESAIEQINLGFNDQEDRLLLKLGLADKTEVAVWITRRIGKAMWSLLQSSHDRLLPTNTTQSPTPATIALASKEQAIENFVREVAGQKSLEGMDFKSAYNADRQTYTEEPMLAVQCVLISTENHPPYLELQCKNGQSVKMALTNELAHAMMSMMQLATREAGWDLILTANSAQNTLNSTQQVLH